MEFLGHAWNWIFYGIDVVEFCRTHFRNLFLKYRFRLRKDPFLDGDVAGLIEGANEIGKRNTGGCQKSGESVIYGRPLIQS